MVKGLVSVIVAAYNAEHLLPRCLDSLLRQTYREMEIIIINDASTDGTQKVIDDYVSKDLRIVPLLMDKNSGAPAARNYGMKHSRGEFLTMVDADDEIAPDTIELTVKEFIDNPEIDFVTFRMIFVYPEDGRREPFKTNPQVPELMTGEEACYWSILYDYAPNGMSRSPLEQSMPAEAEYGQHSDETVTHLILFKARKVKLGKGEYYYYQMSSSVTHVVSPERFEVLDARMLLRKRLQESGVGEHVIRRLDTRRWREFFDMCHFYWLNKSQFSNEEQRKIFQRLKQAYDSFSWRDLPLSTVLKPRFMMLPTFRMFYLQLSLMFKLRLIHK